jgi:hypothetical protein
MEVYNFIKDRNQGLDSEGRGSRWMETIYQNSYLI